MLKPGVYPASVTALTPEGAVDHVSMAKLLAHFEAQGCQGVVLAGTNGEGPSLSAVEKRDLIRAMAPVRGKLEIITGIASNSLEEAVWLCNQAARDGAAAALVMAPAYFREASEDGTCRWFEALLGRSSLPIIVYNFPARTGVTITAQMLDRLSAHPQFAGVKDSSGNPDNLQSYRNAVKENHALFVGNETLLLQALAQGWLGTISGAANVVAAWLVQVMAQSGESQTAKFELLLPVLQAIRAAAQPGTHKAILAKARILATPDLRLPLLPPAQDEVQAVQAARSTLGLGDGS